MSSAGDYAADPSCRMKGATIVKPIVYGNVARYFGKKREEDGHTHQWTVYVRPYRNEDMSMYVKKVHFKLHDSYEDANRIVTKPPYEVTETGWGEFEIVIKIYFYDTTERPSVTLYHILKLFQSGPDAFLGKNSLVSEFYDELMFQDPTVSLYHHLVNVRPWTVGQWKHETDFEEKKAKTLESILSAKTKVRHEISEFREKLKLVKDDIAAYMKAIANSQSLNDT